MMGERLKVYSITFTLRGGEGRGPYFVVTNKLYLAEAWAAQQSYWGEPPAKTEVTEMGSVDEIIVAGPVTP